MIATLDCRAFVTDTEQTTIGLTQPSITSKAGSCLARASTADAVNFTFIPACNDSLLTKLMVHELFTIQSIVPNPARDEVTIAFRRLEAPATIELCDVLGKVIGLTHATPQSPEAMFPLSNVPSGSYYLRSSCEGSVESRRISVQH